MHRLAQFGLGGLGRHELAAFADEERVEIVAGADPDPDARTTFEDEYGGRTYEDYASLLAAEDDLDLVNVVSPHTVHHEQVMAAVDRGLGVHVEKPMVTGIEAAVEVERAVADAGVVVQVGYQRHFDPRFETLREAVAAGTIGDLEAANCFLEQDWIDPQTGTWRTDPALSGGGQLYDSGSHLIDALLWTTDAVPARVAGTIESRDRPVDVHSALSVELDRDGRSIPTSVFVTGDGPTGPGTREGIYLWGTEGSAEYTADGVVFRRKGGEVEHPEVAVPEWDDLTGAKLSAFVDAVEGAENPVPPSVGVEVTALTEAAYRASERDETVDVRALLADARE